MRLNNHSPGRVLDNGISALGTAMFARTRANGNFRSCRRSMVPIRGLRTWRRPSHFMALRIIKAMVDFRGNHPVLEAVWVLVTGPIVVFAVTDWFVKILPTPASIAVSLLGLAGCLAMVRRWDRSDGAGRSKTPRGYRGRHEPQSTDPDVGRPTVGRGPGD